MLGNMFMDYACSYKLSIVLEYMYMFFEPTHVSAHGNVL